MTHMLTNEAPLPGRRGDPYAEPVVRRRLVDYLGGVDLQSATAAYIGVDTEPQERIRPRPVEELPACLDAGADVVRSLWDHQGLLVHLDLDYVNYVFPAEAFLDPRRSIAVQRPVVMALDAALANHRIHPLRLLSPQGFHYVWRIERDSRVYRRLVRLGRLPPTLLSRYMQPHLPHGRTIPEDLGRAHAGLGLVLEDLARTVLGACYDEAMTVTITAVETDSGERGREGVSFDLSLFGDPLHMRAVRIPFSRYHKIRRRREQLGEAVADVLPDLHLIPLADLDPVQARMLLEDPAAVAELARHTDTRIPDQTTASDGLVDAYLDSDMRRFHDWFYAEEHDPPEAWPSGYDRLVINDLPEPARRALAEPNEALLKPAGLQALVVCLLQRGWHPRHIAGLIRSKYERDHGWGDMWYAYDAATRADFYTRIFAGQVHLVRPQRRK